MIDSSSLESIQSLPPILSSSNDLDESIDVESLIDGGNDPDGQITFRVMNTKVITSGWIPCCLFSGQVIYRNSTYEIKFTQKQVVRLHLRICLFRMWSSILWYWNQCLGRKQRQSNDDDDDDEPPRANTELPKWPMLPWSVIMEKMAAKRKHDLDEVEKYIRSCIAHPSMHDFDPLFDFLEFSPLRLDPFYGQSLKEGWVNLRINGAHDVPLFSCATRIGSRIYRQCYRLCLRLSFIICLIFIITPLFFVAVSYVPFILFNVADDGGETKLPDGSVVSVEVDKTSKAAPAFYASWWFALILFVAIVYIIFFIVKFFQRRLGTVRRWCVLKPTCLAAFKSRRDTQPTEVFLFDNRFRVNRGGFRQGVTWMPNGFTITSKSGLCEIDTGVTYMRITSLIATAIALVAVTYISQLLWFAYEDAVFDHGGLDGPISNGNDDFYANSTYCGLYFEAPRDLYVSAKAQDVLIAEMSPGEDAAKNQLEINLLYRVLDSLFQFNFFTAGPNIILRIIPQGAVVGVTRGVAFISKVAPSSSSFIQTNDFKQAIRIQGIQSDGTSARIYDYSSQICVIDFQISPYVWSRVFLLILTFIFGGVVAISVGLGLNYFISKIGLWHAHIRRDLWMEALEIISKQANVARHHYRFESYAPERGGGGGGDGDRTELERTDARSLSDSNSADKNNPNDLDSSPQQHDEDKNGEDKNGDAAIKWLVDGQRAYESINHAIEAAGHSIFIAGWWICPDLHLIRPGASSPETCLKHLLLKKASEGVMIYILLYREVRLALTLNSAYAKQQLKLHKNIRILRDPEFHFETLGFWSHHEKVVVIDQQLAFLGGLDLCFGRYDNAQHNLVDGGSTIDTQLWLGKDYSNPKVKDFIRVDQPFEDLIDRHSIPRMPWHDVHCSITGPPAQDVALHFIQRWNFICSKRDMRLRTGLCICCRTQRFASLPKSILPMNRASYCRPTFPKFFTTSTGDDSPYAHHQKCKLQVLRSVSFWSAGVPLERSIQTAYTELIREARHFIFIENQFFVSGLNRNKVVTNRILQAIVDRIIIAIQKQQTFRVYVLLPLLPAFEGNVESSELSNLHACMHWQFQSISRGEHSLFGELRKWTSTPEQYVHFFGLRNYGVLPNGRVTTEQIYIHSKVLIVDDTRAVVGSANINDRSMNGDRDSEIAVLVEDTEFVDSRMNEQPYRAGKVVQQLRLDLFTEHLGLSCSPDDIHRSSLLTNLSRTTSHYQHQFALLIQDANCAETWTKIRNLASKNSSLFERVFHCAPSNTLRNFRAFGQNVEITQLYENQRLNPLLKGLVHPWDASNLKEADEDYAPWTDVNGVPIRIDQVNLDDYVIDKHLTWGALDSDNDGWIYARKFATFQEVRLSKYRAKRKRDKFQHFMTDRLIAQVRRRRWIKPESVGDLHRLSPVISPTPSSSQEIDEKEPLQVEIGDEYCQVLTPEDDCQVSTPEASPYTVSMREPLEEQHLRSSSQSASNLLDSLLSNNRRPFGRDKLGLRSSSKSMSSSSFRDSSSAAPSQLLLRNQHSIENLDDPSDVEGRHRSTGSFSSSQQLLFHPPLSSPRSVSGMQRTTEPTGEARGVARSTQPPAVLDESQLSQVITAVSVIGDTEHVLDCVEGHLVDFPLDFLAEEILRPAILPQDIHI